MNGNILLVLALAIAVFMIGAFTGGRARAHEPYGDWRQPGGASCCSDLQRECRPVRSYLGDDGRHYVFLSGRWKPVPPGNVLKRPSPDGNSHVCAGLEDEIYCFVAGVPKI